MFSRTGITGFFSRVATVELIPGNLFVPSYF
jgi:hypothetical protein